MAVRRLSAIGEDEPARAVGANDLTVRLNAQVDQRVAKRPATAVTSDDGTGNGKRLIVEGGLIGVGHRRIIDLIDDGMIAIGRGQSTFTRSRHGRRRASGGVLPGE